MEHGEHEENCVLRGLGVQSSSMGHMLTASTSEPQPSSANLSFPRPAVDGSLPDLIVTTLREPTPPAALSSLGARASQQHGSMTRNMEDSHSSLADSTYDMVDDASEISAEDGTAEEDFSADDGDTVSFTSTERRSSNADNFTPEGSVFDQDEHALPNASSIPIAEPSTSAQPPPPIPSDDQLVDIGDFRRQVSEAFEMNDEPADSILSDELETPRQSTIATLPHKIRQQGFRPVAEATSSLSGPINVLLLAAKDTPVEEKDRLFTRLASALAGHAESECRVTKLPPTPAGICPSSSIVYSCGPVALSVKHCIDIQARPAPYGTREHRTYLLRIADVDDEKLSSIFAIGKDIKEQMQMPQLTIFYTSTPTYEEPRFFEVAKNVFKYETHVPRLFLGRGSSEAQHAKENDERGINLRNFYDCTSSSLKQVIESLLCSKLFGQAEPVHDLEIPTATTTVSTQDRKPSWIAQARTWLFANWFHLLVACLSGVIASQSVHWMHSSARSTSGQDIANRRIDAGKSLSIMTNTSFATAMNTFNISHLVPAVDTLSPLDVSVNYQHVPPNQLVVSFVKGAKQPRYPTLLQIDARREDNAVTNNHSKLLDGLYYVSIDKENAYGVLDFSILTANPTIAVNFTQDFGTSLLQRAKSAQRATYERALSKLDTKKLLHDEVGPSYRATRNVTSQLAVQMAKDLQVFANTAVGFATKAAKAGNATAHQVGNDLALVHKDLVKFGYDIHKSLGAATSSLKSLIPSKRMMKKPLAASHEKAVAIRNALRESEKAVTESKQAQKRSLKTLEDCIRDLKQSGKSSLTCNHPAEMLKHETRMVRRVTDVARCVRLNGLGKFRACKHPNDFANAVATVYGKSLAEFSKDAGIKDFGGTTGKISVRKDTKKHKRTKKHCEKRADSLAKQAEKTNRKGSVPVAKKKADQEKRNTHRVGKDNS